MNLLHLPLPLLLLSLSLPPPTRSQTLTSEPMQILQTPSYTRTQCGNWRNELPLTIMQDLAYDLLNQRRNDICCTRGYKNWGERCNYESQKGKGRIRLCAVSWKKDHQNNNVPIQLCTLCEHVGMAVMIIIAQCNFGGNVHGSLIMQQDAKEILVSPVTAWWWRQTEGNATGIEAGGGNETAVEGKREGGQEVDQVE